MQVTSNQRLHLLSLLQSSGLQCSSLHLLFNALVCLIIKLTYALPAYGGQLTADNKNRINVIPRKAMLHGLTLTAFDTDTLIDKSDHKLFRQATQPGHSLHNLASSCVAQWLVAWLSGRTSVFGRRTFSVLRSTCSWWVTTYVGKPSAMGQPTRPTQPFIPSGSIDE